MSKKILLVDDNDDHVELLSLILESEGLDVTACRNPIKALAIASKTQFHLILTDFDMPGINGIQLATELNDQNYGADIVMITGVPPSELAEDAARAGIGRILSKPVSIAELLAIIRSYYSAEQVTSDVEATVRL